MDAGLDVVPAALTGRQRPAKGSPLLRGARLLLVAAAASSAFSAGACRAHFALGRASRSPEAVAADVVRALDRRHLPALRALAVTEAEFREIVWPALPASRPERNVPVEYAWESLRARSDARLRAQVAAWEDRGYRVVAVAFAGPTTDYGRFRVRRKSVVTLRDTEGRQAAQRLFGSMIEMDGRFKVFSYAVD